MKVHQLIHQDSGLVEYYTPPYILSAAHRVLGQIDLDPASCFIANQHVRAKSFYSEHDDGYTSAWFGRVWLNHPFGREERPCGEGCARKTCQKRGYHCTKYKPGNRQWINRLVKAHQDRDVPEALCICFAATSESWFQPLLKQPQCFLFPRTNYYDARRNVVKGVSKGSVVTYFGPDVAKFARHFQPLGSVKVAL